MLLLKGSNPDLLRKDGDLYPGETVFIPADLSLEKCEDYTMIELVNALQGPVKVSESAVEEIHTLVWIENLSNSEIEDIRIADSTGDILEVGDLASMSVIPLNQAVYFGGNGEIRLTFRDADFQASEAIALCFAR